MEAPAIYTVSRGEERRQFYALCGADLRLPLLAYRRSWSLGHLEEGDRMPQAMLDLCYSDMRMSGGDAPMLHPLVDEALPETFGKTDEVAMLVELRMDTGMMTVEHNDRCYPPDALPHDFTAPIRDAYLWMRRVEENFDRGTLWGPEGEQTLRTLIERHLAHTEEEPREAPDQNTTTVL